MSTLEKTLIIGKKQYGLDAGRLIMDCGFYSQHNLKHMHDGGYQFVVPLHDHIYLNEGRRANSMTSFMRRLVI